VLAVEAAAEAFKSWSQTGPGERRALLLKAADALEAKTPQFIDAVSAETGATGMWAGFNVMLAAGMIREAASLTTQVAGEVIPPTCRAAWRWACASRPAWCWASRRGTRRSSWRARDCHAAGLRQHRGAQGLENCPRTHQLIVEPFRTRASRPAW
jgi:hypothetical protein